MDYDDDDDDEESLLVTGVGSNFIPGRRANRLNKPACTCLRILRQLPLTKKNKSSGASTQLINLLLPPTRAMAMRALPFPLFISDRPPNANNSGVGCLVMIGGANDRRFKGTLSGSTEEDWEEKF